MNEQDILRCYYKEVKSCFENSQKFDEQDRDTRITGFYNTLVAIGAITDFVSKLIEGEKSEQE